MRFSQGKRIFLHILKFKFSNPHSTHTSQDLGAHFASLAFILAPIIISFSTTFIKHFDYKYLNLTSWETFSFSLFSLLTFNRSLFVSLSLKFSAIKFKLQAFLFLYTINISFTPHGSQTSNLCQGQGTHPRRESLLYSKPRGWKIRAIIHWGFYSCFHWATYISGTKLLKWAIFPLPSQAHTCSFLWFHTCRLFCQGE